MQRFEFSDGKSNKFWEVDVVGCDLIVVYGRIGTSGQRSTKTFADPSAASSERDKLIKQKTKNGYVLAGDGSSAAAAAKTPAPLSSQGHIPKGGELGQLELSTISYLLSDAADRHEEHTSTDYLLSKSEANLAIIKAAILLEGGEAAKITKEPEVKIVGKELFVHDYCLMRFLASRCEQLASKGGTSSAGIASAGNGLSKEELEVLAKLLDELSQDEFGEYEHEDGCEDFSLEGTDENKKFIISVFESSEPVNLISKIKHVREARDAVEAHAVHVLAYLAGRCRSAAASAGNFNQAELAPNKQDNQTPAVQPLGTYKGWKSEKAVLKDELSAAAHISEQRQQEFADLKVYADGGNSFKDVLDKTKIQSGPLMLPVASALRVAPSIMGQNPVVSMYGGKPESVWLPEYERGAAYWYWSWCIDAQARGTWMTVSLDQPVALLTDCLTLGWLDEARIVAETIRAIYERRLMSCVQGKESQPLYHWIVRICFDFWNMPFNGWGKGQHVELDPKNIYAKNQCFGEPVLNTLFDHWREPDLTKFADHLVWLCDYYTHRTRNQQCLEFAYGDFRARFPATILAWMRLRESLGRPNPTINHPLMNASYAKLPAKRPMYSDPFLEKVLARLRREEMPDLGGGLDVAIKFVDRR